MAGEESTRGGGATSHCHRRRFRTVVGTALALVLAGGAVAVYAVWHAGPPVTQVQSMPGVIATSSDDSDGVQTVVMSKRATASQIEATYDELVRIRSEDSSGFTSYVLDVGPVRYPVLRNTATYAGTERRVGRKIHRLACADVPAGTTISPASDPGGWMKVTTPRLSDAIPAAKAILRASAHTRFESGGLSVRTQGYGSWFDVPPGQGSIFVDNSVGDRTARTALDRLEALHDWHPTVQLGPDPRGFHLVLHLRHDTRTDAAVSAARQATSGRWHIRLQITGGATFDASDSASSTTLIRDVRAVKGKVLEVGSGATFAEVSSPASQLDDVARVLARHHVTTVTASWARGDGRVENVRTASLVRGAPGIQRLRSLGFDVNWTRTRRGKHAEQVITLDARDRDSDTDDPLADPQKSAQVLDALRSLRWSGTALIVLLSSTPDLPATEANTQSFRSTARGRASHVHRLDGTLQRQWDDSASG